MKNLPAGICIIFMPIELMKDSPAPGSGGVLARKITNPERAASTITAPAARYTRQRGGAGAGSTLVGVGVPGVSGGVRPESSRRTTGRRSAALGILPADTVAWLPFAREAAIS